MKTAAKYVMAIDSKSMIFTDPAIRASFFKGMDHVHVIAVVRHEEGELNIPDYVDIDPVKNVVAIPKSVWGYARTNSSLSTVVIGYLQMKDYAIDVYLADQGILNKNKPNLVMVVFKELCKKCDALIGAEDSRIMEQYELDNMRKQLADEDGVEIYVSNAIGGYRTFTHARCTDTCHSC